MSRAARLDCAKLACRRTRGCKEPQRCYWQRKSKLSHQQRKDMDQTCAALRGLLDIGFSKKGSQGLPPF